MDIISLIVISIFIPVITLTGLAIYKPKSCSKLLKFLTIFFLALELFRFFYNAKLYNNAVTPANDIKYSFITLICIMVLFGTFNKGKVGKFFRNCSVAMCLVPVIIAIFYPRVYTNSLDTYAVEKALYFVECGVIISIALVYYLKTSTRLTKLNILWLSLVYLAYVGVNALTIHFWKLTIIFNSSWFICMLIGLISVFVFIAIDYILSYKKVIRYQENDVIAEETTIQENQNIESAGNKEE